MGNQSAGRTGLIDNIDGELTASNALNGGDLDVVPPPTRDTLPHRQPSKVLCEGGMGNDDFGRFAWCCLPVLMSKGVVGLVKGLKGSTPSMRKMAILCSRCDG